VLSNRQEDLLRQDADIAVRMVRPAQKALLATKLGRTRIGLFAESSRWVPHREPTEPVR